MKKLFKTFLPIFLFISCQKQPLASAQNVVASSDKKSQTIQFAGYTWLVRTNAKKQGPGPNFFSSTNAWLDSNGYLHLRLSKDSSGKWQCAEVETTESLGYGTYQFEVEGAIDKFDKNVVLGLFNYSGNDGFDEMDIEFARWGNNTYPNLNYTIWPATAGFHNFHKEQEFSLINNFSTHEFTRDSNSVVLKSYQGFSVSKNNLIAKVTCKSPPHSVSKLAMPVYINLWLFQGNAPTDGKDVEIIIHDFKFSN